MKLGALELFPLTDGRFRLDGGAMFGVVPKALWQTCCPPDELNRIPLTLTCLLVRAHGKHILVDTGLGNKEDARFQARFAVDRRPSLRDSLHLHGLAPDDVHAVINTHLHFDHAGGNTVLDKAGRLRAAFPKATYFIQRGEYEDATRANERTRASYRPDNFVPIAEHRRWELLDGDTELFPGITAVVTAGHTRHHQCVKVESEGHIAFFLGDLIPTVAHLPLPYIMGYDLYPLDTLASKRAILDRAFAERWLLIFQHDPVIQAGYLTKQTEGRYAIDEVRLWQ
ncbi:MAG: putative quorum-quenching lactonase YtnP [Nitrospirae bacterium]|nr:MAG: metallo-beta-lactamase family protein [Nitrospira sp. OLB3]MBV6469863.1 putative quorum-quenching lactonase YtnP [Nitrospirota bacterium]MCE7964468.1 MBL fold metallo-hydrolase [Nitrospira sp. NTP2]MCK6492404.1 MBL fold metallo-hydrolase [Nitrospira sp.]MEB2340071.1 MBL fold metallo-hydrolase [Nitrospirales bacterium]